MSSFYRLLFLEAVLSERLNQVLVPRVAHASILRLRYDLNEIDGGEDALRWICDRNGIRWDWNKWDLKQRERLVEKLWELVEHGVFVILHKFREAVLPAFQQVDGSWQPTRAARSLSPLTHRRFATLVERRKREEQERKEWQSRNQPPKAEVLEPAAGSGTRSTTLGPHEHQTSTGVVVPLSTRASASDNRPELEAIANDPAIRAEIDKSWENSNPHGPGEFKQEQGFWIVRDSGVLKVQQFPSNGTRDSLRPGPMPSGAIAFFHTHPNTDAEGYSQGPSAADVRYANAKGVPGIIQSHGGMYYFGPSLP